VEQLLRNVKDATISTLTPVLPCCCISLATVSTGLTLLLLLLPVCCLQALSTCCAT
jgi:hypothetical protein